MNKTTVCSCVGLVMLLNFAALRSEAQPFAPVNFKLAQTVEQQAVAAKEKGLLKNLENAFEYDDIITAIYRAYDFYSDTQSYQIYKKKEEDLHNEMERRGVVRLDPDSTVRRKPITLQGHANPVLSKVAKNRFGQQDLLENIGPVNPVHSSWENTYYAAMYLPNYLQANAKRSKAFEKFLRQAQLRILWRISQADNLDQMTTSIQEEALGQLRIALISTHLIYRNLFGNDPLVGFNPQLPYERQLDEVVVVGQAKKRVKTIKPGPVKREQVTPGYSVYELQRTAFVKEIAYWKSKLPADTYSFTKTLEALKGRNRTSSFSFTKAGGDVASRFLFIDAVKALGKAVFTAGNTEQTPLSNLRTLGASAVQYDLLDNNFAHVKTVVATLEPEKLAENKYGGIFKNDILYQGTQSTIAEIFNTIYIYAITPGRTPQEWTNVMNLLADFSNPYQYSIMTRLSAIAVAAKILDIRDQALNPYRPNENTARAQQQKLNHERTVLPGTSPLQRPANYNDYMARNIVDIYATLIARGTLAGMQDYGLQAGQMKVLADNLARLYNIFANGTSAAYPRILPPNQANMEQVWTYENGVRVQKLHYFGNRVKTSWGETIEMNLDTPINSQYKFEKDAGEFLTQFAIDVVSWKFMVGAIRLTKGAIGAAMRFVGPARTSLVVRGTTQATADALKPLSFETALKEGISTESAEAANLKYIFDHPLPAAEEVKTYEDALRAVGLNSQATPSQIRRATNNLSLKYHPDKVGNVASARGLAYANEQAARANNLREMLRKGKPSAGVSKLNPQPAAPKSHADEVYDWAAEAAAKEPVRKVDPHSWGNTTYGFAQFFALDYLMSFANEPLQKGMIEDAQTAAQNRNVPHKYGDQQKTNNNPQEAPLHFINDIAQKAEPKRLQSGALVLFPINVVRKANEGYQHLLGKDGEELFKAAARTNSYFHALNAGNVAQFTQTVDKELAALETVLSTSLQQGKAFVEALPEAKKELTRTHRVYEQELKKIKETAKTDLPQARKDLQEAAAKFINANANTMVRAVKAHVQKQMPEDIQVNLVSFYLHYSSLFTLEDAQKIKAIVTNYYKGYEPALISFYTAQQQSLRTGADPAALQRLASENFNRLNHALQVSFQQITKDLDNRMQKWIKEDTGATELFQEVTKSIMTDMMVMYPVGIEDYPDAQAPLDDVFNEFLQEVNLLFAIETDPSIIKAQYQQLVEKRNRNWEAAKQKLIEVGYGNLFQDPDAATQQPKPEAAGSLNEVY